MPKKSSSLKKIPSLYLLVVACMLLLFAAVVGVAFANWLVLQRYHTAQQPVASPFVFVGNQIGKTYRSDTLQLLLEVPESLFVYDHREYADDVMITDQDLKYSNKAADVPPVTFQLGIRVHKDQTVDDLVKNWQLETHGFTPERIQLHDAEAIKGLSVSKYQNVPTVWFAKNGVVFSVTLTTPSPRNEQLMMQILSTLRFYQLID